MDWETTEDRIAEKLRRDSFSDRFCDDICEDILSYLSFKEKIRFECVSKQFQRTIYRKQYTLFANFRRFSQIFQVPNLQINELPLFGQNYVSEELNHFDIKSFDSVLKKCHNIRRLYIESQTKAQIGDDLIDSMIKNCNFLNNIVFNFANISSETKQKFIDKFGSKLKNYNNYNGYGHIIYDSHIILGCPKLEQFSLEPDLDNQVIKNEDKILRHLQKLSFSSGSSDRYFELLIDNNKERLKSLELKIQTYIGKEKIAFFILNLLKLKNVERLLIYLRDLAHFRLILDDGNGPEYKQAIVFFSTQMEIIANNCNSIKGLELIIESIEPSVCLKVFESIKYFQRLKRLKLTFDESVNDNQNYSVESLKLCKNITHLELNFSKHIFQELFFTNINKILPKLQYLSINSVNLTQVMINSISKLRYIRNVKITMINDWNYQYLSYIYLLIENRPKIKSIQIFDRRKQKVFDLKDFYS